MSIRNRLNFLGKSRQKSIENRVLDKAMKKEHEEHPWASRAIIMRIAKDHLDNRNLRRRK